MEIPVVFGPGEGKDRLEIAGPFPNRVILRIPVDPKEPVWIAPDLNLDELKALPDWQLEALLKLIKKAIHDKQEQREAAQP